ncbi:MAG TPA: phenylacetate-CoA oxygenase subunit PaaJ [Bacteroidia bacterium]|nr:phenylacetate-CoA oxygenase subunit PaaJ [Bacteroidia bacterium]
MSPGTIFTEQELMNMLGEIPDPEIPVISIVELGVIRGIKQEKDTVEVLITPTYSGCPAMKQMEEDVILKLKSKGLQNVSVKMIYHPTWTTDWLSDQAREKLRVYGIAPPEGKSDKSLLSTHPKSVTCPRCKSRNTEMVSQFGSTACKALYKCRGCLEVFDYFKCI